MTETDWLAERFETHRDHLRAVALRMLGSNAEADDAVQEAWLRLSRSDAAEITNLAGWLTTVVSRISLDMLRSRASRREEPDADIIPIGGREPEAEAVLADSVGSALLVVLDTLTPAERLAFVLHDIFAVPFDEIGTILGRSTNAAKQMASRARAKVQGASAEAPADPARQREVVDAFLAASRDGDFEALVALLHPEALVQADDAAIEMGTPPELRGAQAVAAMFSGRAKAAQAAEIDGATGMVWMVGGTPKVVWDFTVIDGKIVHIDMIAASDSLAMLDVVLAG